MNWGRDGRIVLRTRPFHIQCPRSLFVIYKLNSSFRVIVSEDKKVAESNSPLYATICVFPLETWVYFGSKLITFLKEITNFYAYSLCSILSFDRLKMMRIPGDHWVLKVRKAEWSYILIWTAFLKSHWALRAVLVGNPVCMIIVSYVCIIWVRLWVSISIFLEKNPNKTNKQNSHSLSLLVGSARRKGISPVWTWLVSYTGLLKVIVLSFIIHRDIDTETHLVKLHEDRRESPQIRFDAILVVLGPGVLKGSRLFPVSHSSKCV